MNIAIFASAFHPSLGGVEELCLQLALELMRQGHGVIVLTNRWPRDLPATETLDGIAVYRLPFRLPEGSAKAAINYHLTHSRIERDMLAILRAHKIDLLHVQCVSSNAHYAMIAQEKLNLPLVVTLQGELTMDANQIFQKSRQAQEILRRSLDRADVITACSGKTLRDGEEFYGKPFGERGRVIFNGVNLADFAAAVAAKNSEPGIQNPEGNKDATENESGALRYSNSYLLTPRYSPEGGSYLFALGRMAKQKGFDVLIKAYAALRFNDQGSRVYPGAPGNNDQQNGQSVSSVKSVDENVSGLSVYSVATPCFPDLILAGDGPELGPLKALARELGLGDCVHFPGRADHASVVRYMQGCELFVLSSRADEGLPVVCAEAMGAGCAIVATRSGGAPEAVLDGETGLLVDKENVEQLAAAMQRLIGNPELRRHLAAAGKARAAEFAWPKIGGQYIAAYAAAAAQ